MTVTAGELRDILKAYLDELSPYSDHTPIRTHTNTYGIGGHYISIAGEGYISLINIRAEDEDDEEEME